MAFEPIIDISTIDLTCIALSEEEVGKINPQAGDMRQLNHVAWLSDDNQSAVGMRYVKDDEFWVDGHIPGRATMPPTHGPTRSLSSSESPAKSARRSINEQRSALLIVLGEDFAC